MRPGAADFVPYLYGATAGRPSKGRPEKVLARLKTITGIWQEDALPGSDGRAGRVTANGSVPAGPSRNGLPEPAAYVYRGSGESKSPAEAARALGVRYAAPPKARRRKPAERERCPDCEAPKPDHLLTCGTVRLPAVPMPEPVPVLAPGPVLAPAPLLVLAPGPVPAERCRKCTYLVTAIGHKLACGEAA